MTSLIFAAGVFNSLDKHWQRIWYQAMPESHWVEQDDWQNPKRDSWVNKLSETIESVDGKKLLVAHSLGCCTILEWLKENDADSHEITGALLVGMPDVNGDNFPTCIEGYDDIALERLPFPAIFVASTDDHYCSIEKSKEIAQSLNAEFVELIATGHINEKSDLGDWKEGQELLKALLSR